MRIVEKMSTRAAIREISSGRNLSENQAYRVASDIITGETTPLQIAALLVGLRTKGETVGEILGFVRAMRVHMTKVCVPGDGLVDTCGTGGDAVVVNGAPQSTFNVSTVAAIVAAGAGCRVAKHGNGAISSRCGSADVLRALGVPVELAAHDAAQCIDEIGVGFLFAPVFHRSLKNAAAARREIGIRTIFNVAGPLANPAGAQRQLVGVFDGALTEPIAQVLRELGSTHCMIVHGEDGVDELSVTGPTRVTELRDGEIHTYTVHPHDFGLSAAGLDDVQGGDAECNAEIAVQVLKGVRGAARDMVLLNAGAAIYVGGACESLGQGVLLAGASIDSGRALHKLTALQACGSRQTV